MFSEAQLNRSPFLRKIMENQKATGVTGLVTAKGAPRARQSVLTKPEKAKLTDPAKVPKFVAVPEPEKQPSASVFAKSKPSKKQVKEYIEEKINRLNSIESESDED